MNLSTRWMSVQIALVVYNNLIQFGCPQGSTEVLENAALAKIATMNPYDSLGAVVLIY